MVNAKPQFAFQSVYEGACVMEDISPLPNNINGSGYP